jgi:hypothetical protein
VVRSGHSPEGHAMVLLAVAALPADPWFHDFYGFVLTPDG